MMTRQITFVQSRHDASEWRTLILVSTQQQSTSPIDVEAAIGQRVRAHREKRGWSQAHLGKLLADFGAPMNQPMVYKLEYGSRPLRVNEVQALALAFDVTMDDLLTGKDASAEIVAAEEAYRRAWGLFHALKLRQSDSRVRWLAAEKELKDAQDAADKQRESVAEARAALEAARTAHERTGHGKH
jgi:transcriptional regulator with XRE-family HTH domain